MKTSRRIVKIDEERCNGCALCIPNCPEGALKIINGKAKLVSEVYCDGLGACVGTCPQEAITIEVREAEEFDEGLLKEHLGERGRTESHIDKNLEEQPLTEICHPLSGVQSAFNQWPIQLMLVNPTAPFFQGADLLVVADCVPFTYANFHQDFLKGKSIVIGCPKIDDVRFYERKLTELFRQSNIKSVTVINMEVACCYGLHFIAQKALQGSGKNIPLKQVIVSIKGKRMN